MSNSGTTAAGGAAPTPEAILQTGLAFWSSKTLLSAAELGVFTVLAEGPLDEPGLRARLGLHARGSRDFFDALVALGFLRREEGRYSNTPETDLFLDRNKPGYLGGFLEMANARLYPFWGKLSAALRTGEPQNEYEPGKDAFATLYADPARLRQFLQAMTGISTPSARVMAAKFPWQRYASFADIGTAQGSLPVQVALAHTHLKGTGFDLAACGPIFEEYVAGFGLQERVRFQAGSFFEEELPAAEVITMGHILHDWNLETKKMLLAKAYRALPAGGALVVYESLIDDARTTHAFGLLMSLNMLIETPGGFDYTPSECQEWMKEAGFRETWCEHLAGPESMVVGIK